MTGYTAGEALGQNPRILKSGEHSAAYYEELWQTITSGREWRGELHNKRKNGSMYWEQTSIAPIYDTIGRMTHFIAVKEDITTRKQADEERERLIGELDAFAHTVAHDIKNPLQIILGYASLLTSEDFSIADEMVKPHLKPIQNHALKLHSIVDELLLLSSVRQAGHVARETLDMSTLMDDVIKRLANLVEEHQAEIVMPDSWSLARGHGPWIEEVWVNYISNGIKYGGRPPRLELGAMSRPDGMVKLWVSDNGNGIAPEDQARLFTPFTRLTELEIKGEGLGLSIVERIMTRLDGEVGVESGIGEGSTFSFTLPGVNA